jgi:hypothetical protein
MAGPELFAITEFDSICLKKVDIFLKKSKKTHPIFTSGRPCLNPVLFVFSRKVTLTIHQSMIILDALFCSDKNTPFPVALFLSSDASVTSLDRNTNSQLSLEYSQPRVLQPTHICGRCCQLVVVMR